MGQHHIIYGELVDLSGVAKAKLESRLAAYKIALCRAMLFFMKKQERVLTNLCARNYLQMNGFGNDIQATKRRTERNS